MPQTSSSGMSQFQVAMAFHSLILTFMVEAQSVAKGRIQEKTEADKREKRDDKQASHELFSPQSDSTFGTPSYK